MLITVDDCIQGQMLLLGKRILLFLVGPGDDSFTWLIVADNWDGTKLKRILYTLKSDAVKLISFDKS